MATPERGEAQGGLDGVGANNRLGAKGRIFSDDQVFDGEAGQRKQRERDAVEVNRAAEAVSDTGSDAPLVAPEVDQRGKEDEQKKSEDAEIEEAEPAQVG